MADVYDQLRDYINERLAGVEAEISSQSGQPGQLAQLFTAVAGGPLSYGGLTVALGLLLQYPIFDPESPSPSSSAAFNGILPRCIEYTETRIQADLDLLAEEATDASATLTANQRQFTLPTSFGAFDVVSQVAVFVGGVRQPPLVPVSREFLDAVYPAETAVGTSIPLYVALFDDKTVLVGPAPDQAYPVEVVGQAKIARLSPTNTSNFLSLQLPQLYLCAAMVFMSGYQRDFGAQTDDPKLAMSWEAQYQMLLKSATVQESRRRWRGQGWNSRQPSPIASPPQT